MIDLVLMWHHHQPLYRDLCAKPPGSVRMPWVRLHAIRDYFSMGAIAAQHPGIRLTINFSPVLLAQLEVQAEGEVTDEAWELTSTPAERLDDEQRERILGTFFDADWHNQIFVHDRYRALFEQRRDGRRFSAQDMRDLQVWFNLSSFGKEFRDGVVPLPDGGSASVASFVRKGSGFSHDDVAAVLHAQLQVMRAIVPLHRELARSGRIELSCSPFAHPILPLVIDTDAAVIDRVGASKPPRFAYPQDADAHVARAVEGFQRWFGAAPRGAWPAEGAVSADVVPIFARHGIEWIATDQGVLARSGRWGYEVHRSEVRHLAYRAESDGAAVSILFRDTELSDDIGFHSHAADPADAVASWMRKLKQRVCLGENHREAVATVILDGENAWGAYRDDGRPFLHALYSALERDPDVRCATPAELLDGNPGRGLAAQPMPEQPRVYELATGSWIDELGSAPGVDLGTWLGEPEENRAWELLRTTRRDLDAKIDHRAAAMSASYLSLLGAEGSDWFWWYGDDQDSGHDADFDELFRMHLANAYRASGMSVPTAISGPIVPRTAVWSFTAPVGELFAGDSLVIRTNCPGELTWWLSPSGESGSTLLAPVGGAMAGTQRHQAQLGPFRGVHELTFTFACRHPGCACSETDGCCLPRPARIAIREPGPIPQPL